MRKRIEVIKENGDETFIPIVILKFGQYDHLMQLLNEGIIFLNSVNNIRKAEDKEDKEHFRNDTLEGITQYTSVGPTELTLVPQSGDPPIKLPVLNITYYGHYEETFGSICSFYGITDKSFVKDQLLPIDERMKQFGSYFIIIRNFDEFIKRIDTAVEKTTRCAWQYGFVKYFDAKNFSGEINLFKKRSIYSYQKEFRLHFKTEHPQPIFVKAWPMRDIASVYPIEALKFFNVKINWIKREAQVVFNQ